MWLKDCWKQIKQANKTNKLDYTVLDSAHNLHCLLSLYIYLHLGWWVFAFHSWYSVKSRSICIWPDCCTNLIYVNLTRLQIQSMCIWPDCTNPIHVYLTRLYKSNPCVFDQTVQTQSICIWPNLQMQSMWFDQTVQIQFMRIWPDCTNPINVYLTRLNNLIYVYLTCSRPDYANPIHVYMTSLYKSIPCVFARLYTSNPCVFD